MTKLKSRGRKSPVTCRKSPAKSRGRKRSRKSSILVKHVNHESA